MSFFSAGWIAFKKTIFVQAMNCKRTTVIFLLFFELMIISASTIVAQERITTEKYIETYQAVAISKMKEYKIPASITLAQAILESGSGNSELARKANNHFGIKCHKDWTGATYQMTDDAPNECFRKYKDPEESFRDHSVFLTQRERYADLFTLKITDYKSWASGLKKAGYATNPHYAELLINLIEKFDLTRFDKMVTGGNEIKIDHSIPVDLFDFIPVNPSDYVVVGKSDLGRFVHENNGSKMIFFRETDDIQSIATEFKIYAFQIHKYNDFKKDFKPEQGMMIYIEAKHRKSAKIKEHTFREGESVHAVSQLYGIRLKRLQKMNKLMDGESVKPGTKLRLR
ncbi:MAG: glucosaminidase domain-containing protein [Bacteroidales bacterium]